MLRLVASLLKELRRVCAAVAGVLIFITLFTVLAQPIFAAQNGPKLLNYQARVTDSSGAPVPDGALDVKIQIWDAASGGTCLYTLRGSCGTPTAKTVTVTNGVFSTVIGDTVAGDNAIPDALFDTDALYLGLTVESDAEMTPRKRLTAAAYAFNADRLDDMDTTTTGAASSVVATDGSGNLTLNGGNVTVDTNTLFVDAANNRVGIGTVTPSEAFHVESATGDVTAVVRVNDPGVNGYSAAIRADGDGAGGGDATFYVDLNGINHGSFGSAGGGITMQSNTTGGYHILSTGDEIMTWLDSGNIGIGDTSPAAMLTVGSGDLFQVNSSGAIAAATGITSSGTISFTGSAMNFGDGSGTDIITLGSTTRFLAPAHANNAGLRLPTNAGAPSGVTGTQEGDIVWDSTGNALYVYDGSAFVSPAGVTGTGSAGHVSYWSSSSAQTYDSDGNFYWDATNNRLGIGTTSPVTKLDIRGGSGASQIVLGDATDYGHISFRRPGDGSNASDIGYDSAGRLRILNSGGGGDIKVQANGGEINFYHSDGTTDTARVMTIDVDSAGGYGVGIGSAVSGDPTQVLHVAGGVRIQSGDLMFDTGTEFTGFQLRRAADMLATTAWQIKSVEAVPIFFGTSNTFRMALDTDGDLGIGTGTPSQKLHVTSTSDTQALIAKTGTGYTSTCSGGGAVNVVDNGTSMFQLYPNYCNSKAMIILGSPSRDGGFDLYNYRSLYGDSTYNFVMTTKATGASALDRFVVTGNADTATAYFTNVNFGIGDTSPTALFTVGSGDLFQVNSSGDMVRIKNVTYSWPSSNASGVLTNDGSGNLSWTAGVTGTGSAGHLSYWSGTSTQTYDSDGNFYWDASNNRLGIGTTSPITKLHLSGGHVNNRGLLYINGSDHSYAALEAPAAGEAGFFFNRSGTAEWIVGIQGSGGTGDKIYISEGVDLVAGARMTLVAGGNVGIGDTSPASMFTVGSGDLFQVNSSGNLVAVRGVTYSWPSSQGGASTVLTNDGSGNLSWAAAATGDITAVGSMTSGAAFADSSADDDWLGLGASAGRIEFDDQTTDEVNILSAKLGIGSQIPAFQLDVTSGAGDGIITRVYSNTATDRPIISLNHARGSEGTPTDTQSGDILGDLIWAGSTTGVRAAASSFIRASATENWSVGAAIGSKLQFFTVTNGGTTQAERLTIDHNGNVGIGDTSPSALLTVGSGDVFQVNSSGAIAAATGITSSGTISFTGSSITLGDNAADVVTMTGTLAGGSPLVFEGATADDFETTFAITDPTADRTITFQNASGTVAFLSDITGANAFVQGGNSFGATAVLGTNDTNTLAFETDGTTRATIDTSGLFTLNGDLTFAAGGGGAYINSADNESLIFQVGSTGGEVRFDIPGSGRFYLSSATNEIEINTTPGETSVIDVNGEGTTRLRISNDWSSAYHTELLTDASVISEFTTLDGTDLANGGGTGATTLVLDDTTGFNAGNYVLVNSTYAKIVSVDSGTNLTISPALTWSDNDAVSEVYVPEIGGLNTANTLTNRFGRGYFIDGIVTGNGSTRYSDRVIESSTGGLSINATSQLGVSISGPTSLLPTLNADDATGAYLSATVTNTDGGNIFGYRNELVNSPTSSANVVYGSFTSITGGGTLANTIFGTYVDVGTANANDITYSGVFTGGNFGVGDLSPAALFTVGNGDLFQVSSVGDVNLTGNDDQTITFAAADSTNSPMIQMFASGSSNGDRMVIAHSSTFNTWGLQYRDSTDDFAWLAGGDETMLFGLSDTQPISFEGATDNGIYTHFSFVDPTVSSKTITFQNLTGTAALQSATTLTNAGILFSGSTGLLTQDATNFVWDDTNDRLGIGTNAPDHAVHINKAAPTLYLTNTSLDQVNSGTILFAETDDDTSVMGIRHNGSTNGLQFYTDVFTNLLTLYRGGSVVVNDDSDNIDFRVESDAKANMLFVDASANRMGLGTASPAGMVHVANTTGDTDPLMYVQNLSSTFDNYMLRVLNNPSYTDTSVTFPIVSIEDTVGYDTAVTTPTISSSAMAVRRTASTSGSFVSTLNVTGPVATFQDSHIQITGTITSSSDVVRVLQDNTNNTGAALNVYSAGTGLVARFNDNGTLTDTTPIAFTAAGDAGFGVASPADKVEVYDGNLRVSNNASPALLLLQGDRGNADDDGRVDGRIRMTTDGLTDYGFDMEITNHLGYNAFHIARLDTGGVTERLMTFGSTGGDLNYVGVLDETPDATLDVIGTMGLNVTTLASGYDFQVGDQDGAARRVLITSNISAGLSIRADRDNAASEDHNPLIYLEQDGGLVSGSLALAGSTDILPTEDGLGMAYTGVIANATVLTANESNTLQLGTNANVRMTIDSAGQVGIGPDNSPDSTLEVNVSGTNTSSLRLSSAGLGSQLMIFEANGSATFTMGSNTTSFILDTGSTIDTTTNIFEIQSGIMLLGEDLVVGDNTNSDDDTLYFDSAFGGQFLQWQNTNDRFQFGNDLDVEGGLQLDLPRGSATEAVCHTGGDVNPSNDANIEDCVTSVLADYMEMYPVAAGVETGDLLMLGTVDVTTQLGETIKQLVKTSGTGVGLLGVASNPIYAGDFNSIGYNIDAADNPYPIALSGRVPVKVNMEGGAIAPGDFVTTSSVPGVGAKATGPGYVIGRAIGSYSGPAQGTVVVFVNPQYWLGATLLATGSVTSFATDVTMPATGVADTLVQGYASRGVRFVGSGWDGATAVDRAMTLVNTVTDASDYRLSLLNHASTEVFSVNQAGDVATGGGMTFTSSGSVLSLASAVEDNTFVIRIPKRSAGNCSSGTAEGLIFQTDAGVQVGHACVNGAGNQLRWFARAFNATSTDLAENYNMRAGEMLLPGEVVMLDVTSGEAFTVTKATRASSQLVMGIVSTDPGILLTGIGEDGERVDMPRPVALALAGRVPTRVNDEGGVIATGDLITISSTPGVAMKWNGTGPILGRALQSSTSGNGMIEVFVHLEYASGNSVASGTSSSSLSGLDVYGNANFHSNILLNVKSILGLRWEVTEAGEFVQKIPVGDGMKSIYAAGSVSPTVMLFGTAALPGASEVVVRFDEIDPAFRSIINTAAPILVTVTATSADGSGLYVKEKSEYGFVVADKGAAAVNTTFDWTVVAYKLGYQPSGTATPAAPAPVVGEPAPGPTEMVVSTEPAGDVVSSEPAEIVIQEPVATEPVATEPVVTEPAATEPITEESPATEPVVTEQVATEPVVEETVVTESVVTEPTPSEPVTP